MAVRSGHAPNLDVGARTWAKAAMREPHRWSVVGLADRPGIDAGKKQKAPTQRR